MTRFLAPILALSCFVGTTELSPAEKPKAEIPSAGVVDPNDHPASTIVIQYLNHALRHEWTKATSLITANSLSNVHQGWVAGVKRNARTIDDEMDAVRLVGKKSLKEVENMDSGAFYAAYHKAQQREFAMDEDRLAQIMKSLQVNVLSAGVEGDSLVHILVRTKHVDDNAQVSNLELVSLRKTESGWRVSLMEKGPKLIPLKKK